MVDLTIEKEVRIEKISTFEVYGKIFPNFNEAQIWKAQVEKELEATWFIIETGLNTEEKFTEKYLCQVFDYLGESGLVLKLSKIGIPMLTILVNNGPYVPNVKITRLDRFETWEEMFALKNSEEFKSIISVTERGIK